LGFAITDLRLGDTITISTLPFTFRTTTLFRTVVRESFETTFFIGGVTLVLAMTFAVTVVLHWNTVTVGTGPLGVWITSTDTGSIELEIVEATLLVALIRTGSGNGGLGHTLGWSWTTGTHLVVPFLETTVLFGGLSLVHSFLVGKLAGVAMVILSIVAHEALSLAVLFTGLTLGQDKSSASTWGFEQLG